MSIPVKLRRWRVHPWLNTALGLSWLALLFETLALIYILLPSDRSTYRGSGIYWSLMLVSVAWGVAVADFKPLAMILFRRVCALIFASSGVLFLLLLMQQMTAYNNAFSQGSLVASMLFSLLALVISQKGFFADFMAEVRTIPKA